MRAYVDGVESPAGPLAFAVDEGGALIRAHFREGDHGETMEENLVRDGYEVESRPEKTARARGELEEYAAGSRRTFDLPLRFTGSEWQNAVWAELVRVPYGETRSYGEIAHSLGRPGAARAVGRANATNRIPVVVPCHRVIGADGRLTGFAGGTHLKVRLLEHEQRVKGTV